MKEKLSILAAMTTFPYTVKAEATLAEAKTAMETHARFSLPVLDGEKLIGVVTEREIMLAEKLSDIQSLKVKDLCLTEPYIVECHKSLESVAQHMADNNIRSTLIMRDDKLVGVFTSIDACRTLAKNLKGKELSNPPDQPA